MRVMRMYGEEWARTDCTAERVQRRAAMVVRGTEEGGGMKGMRVRARREPNVDGVFVMACVGQEAPG